MSYIFVLTAAAARRMGQERSQANAVALTKPVPPWTRCCDKDGGKKWKAGWRGEEEEEKERGFSWVL